MKKSFVFAVASALLFSGVAMASGTKTLNMNIDGMSCSSCASKVKNSLANMCTEVKVDYKTGKGSCVYDPAKATPDQILNGVTQIGYKATAAK